MIAAGWSAHSRCSSAALPGESPPRKSGKSASSSSCCMGVSSGLPAAAPPCSSPVSSTCGDACSGSAKSACTRAKEARVESASSALIASTQCQQPRAAAPSEESDCTRVPPVQSTSSRRSSACASRSSCASLFFQVPSSTVAGSGRPHAFLCRLASRRSASGLLPSTLGWSSLPKTGAQSKPGILVLTASTMASRFHEMSALTASSLSASNLASNSR
mmetsp:Transcript_36540/g.92601  ORF Transcript_36540/g.92601 Transcript_36540/m.92601 type:complete len:217 (+) Transcript_36540:464-1114(+)